MAITGVKDFQAGAILTAADLNTYNRGVFVFADAAARTSAFSAAGITLAEGWFSYLTGTNSTEYYDGAAWVAVAAANVVSTVASASSIAVTGPGTYLLTGTTTVATITGGVTGMTITVQASAQASGIPVVLTYGTGANAIKLASGRSLGIYAQVPADTAAGAGESVTLRYDGTAWTEIARDLRTLLAYAEKTTDTTVTSTATSGADIATTSAITMDGSTVISAQIYAAGIGKGSNWIQTLFAVDGTRVYITGYQTGSNTGPATSLVQYTPTAGSHTFGFRANVDAGSGLILATSPLAPSSIRISRAS